MYETLLKKKRFKKINKWMFDSVVSPTGCVATIRPVNIWPSYPPAMWCWWRWRQTTSWTSLVSEHKSRKSNAEVEVRCARLPGTRETFSHRQYLAPTSFFFFTFLTFNRNHMWRSADWWKGEVYFPQLSKLLSTTHVMPVVDQGEASTSCVCHLRAGEKVS